MKHSPIKRSRVSEKCSERNPPSVMRCLQIRPAPCAPGGDTIPAAAAREPSPYTDRSRVWGLSANRHISFKTPPCFPMVPHVFVRQVAKSNRAPMGTAVASPVTKCKCRALAPRGPRRQCDCISWSTPTPIRRRLPSMVRCRPVPHPTSTTAIPRSMMWSRNSSFACKNARISDGCVAGSGTTIAGSRLRRLHQRHRPSAKMPV